MLQTINHHTHTTFSDGRSTLSEVLAEALRQNLRGIGITDHSPIDHPAIGHFETRNLGSYVQQVLDAKQHYAGQLEVYLGMEIDYIPGLVAPRKGLLAALNFDYIIGAVHYVNAFADGTPFGFEASEEHFVRGVNEIFSGSYQRAFERYFELIRDMIQQGSPEIVAHLDRMRKHNKGGKYFDETAAWYRDALDDTLALIAAKDLILEVNTKGLYKGETTEPYPSRWALRRAHERGIRVHLASDAHEAGHLTSGFAEATEFLTEAGYLQVTVLRDGQWGAEGLKQFA